jgi:hypothetical protein
LLRGGDPSVGRSEHYTSDVYAPSVEDVRSTLAFTRQELGEFEIVAHGIPAPNVLAIRVRSERGRPWGYGLMLDPEQDHRIKYACFQPLPDHLTTRAARPEDGPLLAALERRAPVAMGDSTVVYERPATDYFADDRLMGTSAVFVVEDAAGPIGLAATATHEVCFRGIRRTAGYGHRLRVAPDVRQGGARGPGAWASFLHEATANCDFSYGFTAAANETMLRHIPRPFRAPLRPERLVIDTSANAGTPAGRAATPSDAGAIADMVNATHGDAELFIPYSAQRLRDRLERAPDLYTWSCFRVGNAAVVGVRRSVHTVRRRDSGGETVDVRAHVLDYGASPGAETELLALMRSACAELTAAGNTELTIFSAPPSPLHPPLHAMAKRVDRYVLNMPPARWEGLEDRGLYVDQLYF